MLNFSAASSDTIAILVKLTSILVMLMPKLALLLLTITALIGCNTEQLRFSTLRLSRTVPDLQQSQVLDNIARYVDDPGLMPYFSLVYAGTMNVADRGSITGSWTGGPRQFTEGVYDSTGERTITGNWSLKPTNDSDRLLAFRAAIQMALSANTRFSPTDYESLLRFLRKRYPDTDDGELAAKIPQGWLCVGTRHDCPKHLSYWAYRNKTYVWVKPGREEEFMRFALLCLDIFTLNGGLPEPSFLSKDHRLAPPSRVDDGLPFNPGLFFVR